MTDSIHIEDVGPIVGLDIPLPEGGGVVVLAGANGSGKTTAIKAAAALTGTRREKLSHRDGSTQGRVDGLGAKIAVKATMRRSGETVLGADQFISDIDPGILVDPGLKSPEAADRARIRFLLEATGMVDTRAAWVALVGDELYDSALGAEEDARLSPVDRCDKLKRALEAEARESERSVERLAGQVDSLSRQIDEALDGLSVEEFTAIPHDIEKLRADHEAAVTALATAEGRAERAVELQDLARAAKAELAEVEGSAPSVENLESRLKSEALALEEAKRALEAARESVREREARLADRERVHSEVTEALADATRLSERIAKLRTTVESSEGAAINEGELNALREAKAAAQRALSRGETVCRVLPLVEDRGAVEAERRKHDRRADDYRSTARATDSVLSDLVAKAGVAGLRVDGGRLVSDATDRALAYFSDLSDGERWTVALDLGVRAVGRGGLLAIQQAAWEALDPANRRLVAQRAKDAGVWLLTAEATDGPLRAEAFDA